MLISRAGLQFPGHSVHGSIIQVNEMLQYGQEGTADGLHITLTHCWRGGGFVGGRGKHPATVVKPYRVSSINTLS